MSKVEELEAAMQNTHVVISRPKYDKLLAVVRAARKFYRETIDQDEELEQALAALSDSEEVGTTVEGQG